MVFRAGEMSGISRRVEGRRISRRSAESKSAELRSGARRGRPSPHWPRAHSPFPSGAASPKHAPFTPLVGALSCIVLRYFSDNLGYTVLYNSLRPIDI